MQKKLARSSLLEIDVVFAKYNKTIVLTYMTFDILCIPYNILRETGYPRQRLLSGVTSDRLLSIDVDRRNATKCGADLRGRSER